MIDRDLVLKTGRQINAPVNRLCIKAAGGHRLPHHGWQTVPFKTESGVTINCRFEVSDIGKGILSVSQLVDKGYKVIFAGDDDGGSRIVKQDGQTLQLRRERGVYMLPCDLQQKRAEPQAFLQTMPVDVDSGPGGPGAVAVRSVQKPASREEVERRNLTHLPHAAWCEVCVPARAKEAGRFRNREVDNVGPAVKSPTVFQVDYTFASWRRGHVGENLGCDQHRDGILSINDRDVEGHEDTLPDEVAREDHREVIGEQGDLAK